MFLLVAPAHPPKCYCQRLSELSKAQVRRTATLPQSGPFQARSNRCKHLEHCDDSWWSGHPAGIQVATE